MKLDRLILVNWGQLRPGNFDMGDMTLLTGETGSGKSTMLDALQTVMTGANKGIMNYNPGQDEVTQGQRRGKTKRSLESYIVGAEYNNYSRSDGAQGYMAAVFRPSKGEEHLKPFTALIGASARVEGIKESRQARLESLQLLIVDDAALTFEDFMKDVQTNECIAVDHISRHLQSTYPRVRDFNDKKMDYLCALYGRFRGKSSVTKDEASNAAKAWVQSIAYRPIGSVHELVRDEILDFDEKQLQQDIERISGLMRQVSSLRQESVRLQGNVKRLSTLQLAIDAANKAHEAHVIQGLFVTKLQIKTDDGAIQIKKDQISKADEESTEEAGKIKAWKERLGVMDEQRVQLTARLQGIPVHNQKIELDEKLGKATAAARANLESLALALISAGLLEQRARELISKPIPDSLKALKATVERVATAYRNIDFDRFAACRTRLADVSREPELNVAALYELVTAFSGINQGIDNLHEALVGPNDSVFMALVTEAFTTEQAKAAADDLVRDLGSKKLRLAQGKVSYPNHVQRGLDLLNEQFPDANAQVLCDLVEPKSDKWQSAIESYLGGARFNLIVSTAWERQCVDLLKSRSIGAKVVQGTLCLRRSEGKMPPTDSIVNELKSANPTAWAFLVEQYAGVVKVADTEALRHTDRGVTLDGIASGGRAMFTMDKNTVNVFGTKARELALARVITELESAQEDAAVLSRTKSFLDSVKNTLQTLKAPRFDAGPLREATNVIDKTLASLENLDITELNEMHVKLKKIQDEIDGFNDFIQISQHKQGELSAFMGTAEKAIAAIKSGRADILSSLEGNIQKLKHLAESNPALSYPALALVIEKRLQQAEVGLDGAKKDLESAGSRPEHFLVDAREALVEYNSQAKTDERIPVTLQQRHDTTSFDANYAALVTMGQQVIKMLDGLRSIGLYNNSQELDKAEKSFHDVFTKSFCVEIKSRVEEGMRTLRDLNKQLENLKFGSDSFSIDWSRWDPDLADYLSFFTAVTKLADSAEPMDLFGEEALSEQHAAVRDKLVKLLLDENQDRAAKELMRIADYRNYRHYDIINKTSNGGEVKLSEWGTGSGGQLETPAYIVRAAVVTNRLKLFDKSPSLKLLVNDESFAKMDEPRARAVLSFLRDKLNLQIISAMPTMKAGALKDEFSREYSFTRLPVPNGELDFISECDERIFKPDKMRQLWETQRVQARETARQLFESTNPPEDIVEINIAGVDAGAADIAVDVAVEAQVAGK